MPPLPRILLLSSLTAHLTAFGLGGIGCKDANTTFKFDAAPSDLAGSEVTGDASHDGSDAAGGTSGAGGSAGNAGAGGGAGGGGGGGGGQGGQGGST